MQSVALPFDWGPNSTGDVVTRVRNIYKLVAEGHSLASAAGQAAGRAPLAQHDWPSAAASFKVQKLHHGNTIKSETWEHAYGPVVAMAVELLTGKRAPASPADLMDACIRDWKPGSRMRQIRAQSLAQFLRHAVDRAGIPALWAPPADLKQHVGARSPATAVNQAGDPFTDQQILDLLAALPEDAAGRRWADAIRLLAELGLRPGELLHLQVKIDPATGENHWWCSYQKRSGGGITEPRRVEPIPLVDADGVAQQWNLMLRWQGGLIELPPISSGNGAGDGIRTYLNRQSGWKGLRAEMAAKGENAVPYSFRHSYSLRCHRLGIDAGSAASSMGHSLEVHLRSYPWASKAGTASAFARARANLSLAATRPKQD
jgi:integrase